MTAETTALIPTTTRKVSKYTSWVAHEVQSLLSTELMPCSSFVMYCVTYRVELVSTAV